MILYIAISYAIWVSRNLDSPINIHTSNIVNWYRNQSLKTASSYILFFERGKRLNSTVSNHGNNRKFGKMLRWFWQYPFHMQHDHDGVEITYQYSNSKHSQLTAKSISKNRIIAHLVVWTRQALEFDSIISCQTIEKSAELPHMEHIARNEANHQITTTYGLQYNCG